MSEDLQKRALKRAKDAAWGIAGLLKSKFIRHPTHNWDTLGKAVGITITGPFTQLPCNLDNVKLFAQWWIDSVESRIATNIDNTHAPDIKVDRKQQSTFGEITLFPEQEGTFQAIYKALFVDRTITACLNDGTMGSGKTFLAGALISHGLANNKHIPDGPLGPFMADMPYRVMIITRKVIVHKYTKELVRMGLGDKIGTTIVLTAYSQLSSSFGKIFIREVYDAYTEKTTWIFNDGITPWLVIWDECHGLNNPNTQQTKFALAMNRCAKPPIQIFMSATPMVKVNDIRTFVIASRFKWLGQTVTEETFPTFAGTICKRPDKPNNAASKRLREILADRIFSFPKIKWPHKAINQCLIVDFANDKDRQLQARAWEVFLEKKRQAGENTKFGGWELAVAQGQYRKAAEPCKVPAFVHNTMEHLRTGDKAVLFGCAYRETVQRSVYELMQQGLSRDDISIIWGGKKTWKQDRLLSEDELNELMRKAISNPLEDDELLALSESIEYRTERIMRGETAEEQASRVARLEALGLAGTQSADQRQREVDNFQEGRSRVCIFTLAAGGVGLSLDHCYPHTLPRVGYFTPVFSGPEAQQALGRGVRRATLSDTYQFMMFLRGTVEEHTMAPAMDKNLKSIASFTRNFFNLMKLDSYTHQGTVDLRTAAQAELDANNDDTQLDGTVIGDTDNENDEEDSE